MPRGQSRGAESRLGRKLGEDVAARPRLDAASSKADHTKGEVEAAIREVLQERERLQCLSKGHAQQR